jgi:choice-of-anchor B domain-containing protein
VITKITKYNKVIMTQKLILFLLTIASTILSQSAIAHTEHDKARFVAMNGSDKGQCNNPIRPCKTIAFAVSQASKGDKVLVAKGQYELKDESELFYLKSKLVPVIGGFNRFDHFQVQSPDSNLTHLIGAPLEMRDSLFKAGFRVIADRKSLAISASLKEKLARYNAMFEQQSNQPCVNGSAGAFSCNNVDLVAHMPLSNGVSGSDIWGHVDLNTGTEYAIMGFSDGTRVYNLADPSNPTLVGKISGSNTSWRDIKVYQYFDESLNAYQAYAYITSEASNGIQIINLNNLPQSISLAGNSYAVTSAHNVYISNVDYSLNLPLNGQNAKMQIVGANRYGGAFTTFDLSNPSSPSKGFDVGSSNANNYTHDATSMLIDDERASRDCVNGQNGQCDVFIDFNEDEIRIWDATDTSDTRRLGTVGYNDVPSSNQYIHSGWWHENKRYVYVHDEFDEYRGGLNTTVRILDLYDLTNPTIVGNWTSNNATIDHNGFVVGNRYYMSNYERGLTILDISDPTSPVEIGYFDTFPSSNNPSFNGAWGTYPYLPSGNILISDINSGLYIVKDKSLENISPINFANTSVTTEQNQQVTLLVNKPASSSQAVTVDFSVINGSAKLGIDMSVLNATNTLSWAAGDNEPKSISLSILDSDKTTESNLFIQLFNATGNTHIGDNRIAQINIEGQPSPGKVGFVETSAEFSETDGDIQLLLNRVGGSSGSVTVNYQIERLEISDGDVVFENGSLTWEEGDTANKYIAFSIVDDNEIEAEERFNILLSSSDDNLLSNTQIQISINDDDSNNAPEVYAGNDIEMATNASVVLESATASDDRTAELAYQWQQISGVEITLSSSNSINPTVTASSEAGTAVISFTATDEHGDLSSDELTITVIAPTPAPSPTPTPAPETAAQSSSSGAFFLSLFGLIALISIRRK